MSEQERLGFNDEADFIRAVQETLKKYPRDNCDENILKAFVDDYSKYVEYIVKKQAFGCTKEDQDDLRQHILTHIIAKIGDWKYEGKEFVKWLYRAGFTAAADWWRVKGLIKIPPKLYKKIKAYMKAQSCLQDKLGREPSNTELSEKLGWSEEETREIALYASNLIEPTSLDDIIEDEEGKQTSRVDLIPDPLGDDENSVINKIAIDNCLNNLKPIYRYAFILCYRGHTQKEIASILGINQRAANSRISRAKKQLKNCLKENGVNIV